MSKHRNSAPIEVRKNQACVVMEKKYWDHMVQVYSILADDVEDLAEKADWLAIIGLVKAWVEATYVSPIENELEEDEWN